MRSLHQIQGLRLDACHAGKEAGHFSETVSPKPGGGKVLGADGRVMKKGLKLHELKEKAEESKCQRVIGADTFYGNFDMVRNRESKERNTRGLELKNTVGPATGGVKIN